MVTFLPDNRLLCKITSQTINTFTIFMHLAFFMRQGSRENPSWLGGPTRSPVLNGNYLFAIQTDVSCIAQFHLTMASWNIYLLNLIRHHNSRDSYVNVCTYAATAAPRCLSQPCRSRLVVLYWGISICFPLYSSNIQICCWFQFWYWYWAAAAALLMDCIFASIQHFLVALLA